MDYGPMLTLFNLTDKVHKWVRWSETVTILKFSILSSPLFCWFQVPWWGTSTTVRCSAGSRRGGRAAPGSSPPSSPAWPPSGPSSSWTACNYSVSKACFASRVGLINRLVDESINFGDQLQSEQVISTIYVVQLIDESINCYILPLGLPQLID